MYEPVTAAVKLVDWPVSNEALPGEMLTVTVGVSVPTGLPPPQPAVSMARSAMKIALLQFRKSGNRLFPSLCPVGRSLVWARCKAARPPHIAIGGLGSHV